MRTQREADLEAEVEKVSRLIPRLADQLCEIERLTAELKLAEGVLESLQNKFEAVTAENGRLTAALEDAKTNRDFWSDVAHLIARWCAPNQPLTYLQLIDKAIEGRRQLERFREWALTKGEYDRERYWTKGKDDVDFNSNDLFEP